MSAQRDPHLGPDAALVLGGCLLEPFAELVVEDDADRGLVGCWNHISHSARLPSDWVFRKDGVVSRIVTRRERIGFLLAHYHDVLVGLWDDRAGGSSVPLMCSAWNHRSYQELERLLPLLAAASPPVHRAVVAWYVYPRFVRRAWCPRCGQAAPPEHISGLRRHGQRTVALTPKMVRQPPYRVDERLLPLAVAWFDREWRGGVFVPAELLPLVSAA